MVFVGKRAPKASYVISKAVFKRITFMKAASGWATFRRASFMRVASL